jgi:two-component system chemotaxis response regulator CheY
MRSLIRGILVRAGWEVADAENGQVALGCLAADPRFDVALVDWNMPVMNGYDFVRAVRADPRWAGLLVVMVTTEAEVSRMESALAAGVNEYVMKPFTPECLLGKIELAESGRGTRR